MKFVPGDVVEIIGGRATHPALQPGRRGVIVDYVGPGYSTEGDFCPDWYHWICEGIDVYSQEAYLRKVPPDPGRELTDFDWRTLVTKHPEIA